MGEPTVPIGFISWLLGAIGVLLGGCWAIFKYYEAKLTTVYRRMDENKKAYYADFVLLAVFRENNDAKKELTDQKFQALIALFNEKVESLRNEIKNLSDNKKN